MRYFRYYYETQDKKHDCKGVFDYNGPVDETELIQELENDHKVKIGKLELKEITSDEFEIMCYDSNIKLP